MDKLLIKGGVPLEGTVGVYGSKNSVLPLLAACLLTKGVNVLRNIPILQDLRTMLKLLKELGAEVELCEESRTCRVDSSNISNVEARYEMVKTMRSSILVLGPLIARFGRARVSLPGGCAIGSRPVNFHLDGLNALGVETDVNHGYIEASVTRLKPNSYTFPQKSVTGTENMIMASIFIEGQVILENCAKEPHIFELVNALNKAGANIEGAGSDEIVITGVSELQPLDFTVQSDYIEAGTYVLATAATKGNVLIKDFPFDYLESLLDIIKTMGVKLERLGNDCRVSVEGELVGADVVTGPYPGFPTDMQAQMAALMVVCRGISVITENIFENRFMHVNELVRLGANIRKEGKSIIIKGGGDLSGAQLMATDLRASASLVIAGLASKGITEVNRIYHLDRGYERMDTKLTSLNAKIARVHHEVNGLTYWANQ